MATMLGMGKAEKSQVDYSEGMAEKRCKNCVNFHRSAGAAKGQCLRVYGDIDPDYWCRLFEPIDE